MYRWRNNGGWNKSHGQVEKTPRIDSYEVADVGYDGVLFASRDNGVPLVLDCCREVTYTPGHDIEAVEIWHRENGMSWTVELSRKENGYGGNQAFFLCPACGERRRYLYLTGTAFLCRKCARLNYRSQQETRSGSMYYYDKGMALAEKRLNTWPMIRPDGFAFCDWIPERPRYMHESTYMRYLRRFLRYRQRHEARELEDLRKLLGPREWGKLLSLQYED